MKYLPAGLKLTADEREQAKAVLQVVRGAISPKPDDVAKRLEMIIGMILVFPAGNSSAEATQARGRVYMDALDDVPPWVLARAIRGWTRGEWSGQHNFNFAPSPAALRKMCIEVIKEPIELAANHIEDVLAAKASVDDAMRDAGEASAKSDGGMSKLPAPRIELNMNADEKKPPVR